MKLLLRYVSFGFCSTSPFRKWEDFYLYTSSPSCYFDQFDKQRGSSWCHKLRAKRSAHFRAQKSEIELLANSTKETRYASADLISPHPPPFTAPYMLNVRSLVEISHGSGKNLKGNGRHLKAQSTVVFMTDRLRHRF
jgi:hypothetical protein